MEASEFLILLMIDAQERVKKPSRCRLRNVVKLINDKDNPRIVEQLREFLKEFSQREIVGYLAFLSGEELT